MLKYKSNIDKWENFMQKHKTLFPDKISDIDRWKIMYKYVDDYTTENGILPPEKGDKSNAETSNAARWITKQKRDYKNKEEIMLIPEIYNLWINIRTKYPHKFTTIEEDFYENLNINEEFIKKNNRLPIVHKSENQINKLKLKNIKYKIDIIDGGWIQTQKGNWLKKKDIFKSNEKVYKDFELFMARYPHLFIFDKHRKLWYSRYNNLKENLDNNSKIPIELNKWIQIQNQNYKKRLKTMNEKDIYETWGKFKIDYKKFLTTDENIWESKINDLSKFIDINQKIPTKHSDSESGYGKYEKWIWDNNKNYLHPLKYGVLRQDKYRNLWKNFIIKYQKYFTNHKINIDDYLD
jgi:hypothetical protein